MSMQIVKGYSIEELRLKSLEKYHDFGMFVEEFGQKNKNFSILQLIAEASKEYNHIELVLFANYVGSISIVEN